MKYTAFWRMTVLVIIAVLAITACTPAATPVPATAVPATAAPAQPTDTTAPAQPTAAPVQPTDTAAPAAPTATTAAPAAATTIGMVLVGPYNDNGWSQATYEGAQYVVSKLPGTKLIYIDNAFGQQGSTPAQLGDQLVSKGANVIIFNSDAFMDDSNTFAAANPKIPTFMLSGDQNWDKGQNFKNIPNMINIMGRMEYMKEVAGCAAALTTKTGKIGFLGPLINPETRRLAASAFLGAKYCWTKVLNKDAKALSFEVTWIGNWFNIPGQTLDPTQVADNFFKTSRDVVISGIDTTEALAEAKKMNAAGQKVFAVSYDYIKGCDSAPDVCLGVPYFNWGPAMLTNVKAIQDGSVKAHFEWNAPDWANFNAADSGGVGFTYGKGLSAENTTKLQDFVKAQAGGLNLWTGPINLQDGTAYLKDGEVATDQQIWYLPQLLEGMTGKSK